jgi:hypothetical protein
MAAYCLVVLCMGFGIVFGFLGLYDVPLGGHLTPVQQGLTLMAVVLTGFGLAGWTWLEGRLMAVKVSTGTEVAGRVLNIRAIEVAVTWTEDESAAWLDTSSRYLFLGEGDRWLVLFDPQKGQTIRIPTGKATLTSTHLHPIRPLFRVVWDYVRSLVPRWRRRDEFERAISPLSARSSTPKPPKRSD